MSALEFPKAPSDKKALEEGTVLSPRFDAAGLITVVVTHAADGMLLMVEKDVLWGWKRGEAPWRRLADLAALGLHGVTRIAISPKGDRIAFVAQ